MTYKEKKLHSGLWLFFGLITGLAIAIVFAMFEAHTDFYVLQSLLDMKAMDCPNGILNAWKDCH